MSNILTLLNHEKFFSDVFLYDLDFSYAIEIIFRTTVMFSIILIFLRLTGKKGIRQLSIFEVAIIIALGSAAGDPMIDQEMAIIPSLIAFISTLILYRSITYFAAKYSKVESLIEGQPIYVIEDGKFSLNVKEAQTLGKDEFFAEMRESNISHVGQVKTAILETNGKLSIFYFEQDQVKYGLPILPKEYNKKTIEITVPNHYACTTCGETAYLHYSTPCSRCQGVEWVLAAKDCRVT